MGSFLFAFVNVDFLERMGEFFGKIGEVADEKF